MAAAAPAAAVEEKVNAVVEGTHAVNRWLTALPWLRELYQQQHRCASDPFRARFQRRADPAQILVLEDFVRYYENSMHRLDDFVFPPGSVLLIRDPEHVTQCHAFHVTNSYVPDPVYQMRRFPVHVYEGLLAGTCQRGSFEVEFLPEGDDTNFSVQAITLRKGAIFLKNVSSCFMVVLVPADTDVLPQGLGREMRQYSQRSRGGPDFRCEAGFWESLREQLHEGARRPDRQSAVYR